MISRAKNKPPPGCGGTRLPGAGPGRPKGSKNRRPLALQDMFATCLELAGDHIAKNGQLKALGFDQEVNGGLAYLLKLAISDDIQERRMFWQGLMKMLPTQAAVKHEMGIGESLERLLEQSREIEADIIDARVAGAQPDAR